MPDENSPEAAIANIVNDILLRHRDIWNGNDEIQDMVVEAVLLGIKYWQER